MNNSYIITPKQKNKHLSYQQYEFIINQVIMFEAKSNGTVRNTGKTEFIKHLAASVGTSVSNVYAILKDSKITVYNSDLTTKCERSINAAFNKRSKSNKVSNISKLTKAKPFIDLVINEVKNKTLTSIDEAINDLIINRSVEIEGMTTVSTKTFYNYVNAGVIALKPIDLPRMVRLRKKKNYKEYIPKRQKGTSIDLRPKHIDNREEFGHWEGDLVTGPRDGKNGALLTLIERKTRFYYMIPLKDKSSKQVLMAINKLNRLFDYNFTKIFKTITFDNGSEFSRYRDIEKHIKPELKRTQVFFAHPYHSWERGSNENCNGLVRRFIKKGTDINKLDKAYLRNINIEINEKKRKLHGYKDSSYLFKTELSLLTESEIINFYL